MTVLELKQNLDKFPDHWTVEDKAGDALKVAGSDQTAAPWRVTLEFAPNYCLHCKTVRTRHSNAICDGCAVRALGGRLD
jgi:hypothetical protein